MKRTFVLLLGFALGAAWVEGGVPRGEVVRAVYVLENMHYLGDRALDDRKGNLAVELLMERLDPGKYYFNLDDYQKITARHRDSVDDAVRAGDLGAGEEIFTTFLSRVRQRGDAVGDILAGMNSFPENKNVRVRGPGSEWVEEADMPTIWRERLSSELQREGRREKDIDKARENIKKRHAQLLSDLRQEGGEGGEMLLEAVCQSYDPHTEYLGKESMSEFGISMELQLCGIGVILTQENGFVEVESIMPGGPAALDGRLRKGDQIVGVGNGGRVEEISGLRIDKVVKKIRGKKGSPVTLEISRGGDGIGTVTIRRDEVQLNTQAARGGVFTEGETGTRIGVVAIPSFYHDGRGRSVSDDTEAILRAMRKMGVSALVIDLRQDGGGSLEEAISTAGLFVPGKTVVQIRDRDGGVENRRAEDREPVWDGPLVVLVDRSSASASEIFAGAIKDHRAGVLVGDSRTFGKGTVQAMMDLSPGGLMRFISPDKSESGNLKLTIQEFYRANGESTQGKGIDADIRIPSPADVDGGGEAAFRNPMPRGTVEAAEYGGGRASDAVIEELRKDSLSRISASPTFIEAETRRKQAEEMKSQGLIPVAPAGGAGTENLFLKTKADIITTLRGARLEVSSGELESMYDGNSVVAGAKENGDAVLEEAALVAADWAKMESKIAKAEQESENNRSNAN